MPFNRRATGSGVVLRPDVMVTNEHVGAGQRERHDRLRRQRAVRADASIFPGNSGGALLDAQGGALGVSLDRLTPPIRDQFDVRVQQGALVLGVEQGGRDRPRSPSAPSRADVRFPGLPLGYSGGHERTRHEEPS